MQLGTRWAIGDEPPARLTDEVIAAIRSVENNIATDPTNRRWTLTWLEGRPIVELDPAADSDDITAIRIDPDTGAVRVDTFDPDEESEDD